MKLALRVERLAPSVEAVVVAAIAGGAVSAVGVLGAVLRVSEAVLGDVTRPAAGATLGPVRPELAGGEVAAGSRGALGVGGQPTGVGIAARVAALLRREIHF